METVVSLEKAIEFGLLKEEYQRILTLLKRTPTLTELGIFSVMWSEHCSYKNSIAILKKLPKESDRMLVKAGEENAGILDIGDGLAVVFKIESHNHPSAIEPYQGAATGVGGIHRDIFTMGARPIAALNSLRFGSLNKPTTRYLLRRIVKGIGDYGNAFGVPTVAGEIYFDDRYAENPIVNAMSVGIVEKGKIASAIAEREGSPVFIVGASTGKDGIHGATFASDTLSESSKDMRPCVQVGDPFMEKLLLEATLESINSGALIGIQDMGAAGLTCSSSEMTAKGIQKNGVGGMYLNLDDVPIRDETMTGYEIMLSESQERMLLVLDIERKQEVIDIYQKWGVPIKEIGKVTDTGRLQIYRAGKKIADVSPLDLVLGGNAPVYYRVSKEKRKRHVSVHLRPDNDVDIRKMLFNLLQSPNISNKSWVYNQYDSMVQTNTVTLAGTCDAAVVRIKGTKKALAMKVDCNARYVYLNPKQGAMIAVSECTRNIACTGGKPIGITNCLNFGNPYNPDVFFQFKEVVQGITDMCNVLSLPVTGGNVSFYNEAKIDGDKVSIYPTPVIGAIGMIDDFEKVVPATFQREGERIFLLGKSSLDLNGSEFLHLAYHQLGNDTPSLNADDERRLQDVLVEATRCSLLSSAHDISTGGLATSLVESAVMDRERMVGAKIEIYTEKKRTLWQELLFSESQSQVLLSLPSENEASLRALTEEHHLPLLAIGKTSFDRIEISINNEEVINEGIDSFSSCYYNAFSKQIEAKYSFARV